MKNGLVGQSGGKTYLFSIIFNLAVQFAFSFVLVLVMVLTKAGSAQEIPGYSTWNLAAMALLQGAFFAAIVVTRPRLTPVPTQKSTAWLGQIAFSVGAALVCLMCFSWLGEWFALLLNAVGYNLSDIAIKGPLDITLAIAVTVIMAPIIEETVFRNALIGDLKNRHGMLVTVALSGLCFALMHMSPQQTVYQFCLGCVCAYVFLKTGNIVCPIIIHAINNGCAIALSFANIPILTPKEGSLSVLTENIALSAPITLLLAAAGTAIIYYAGKFLFKKPEAGYFFGESDGGGKIPCRIAIIICIVMWIFNFIGSLG